MYETEYLKLKVAQEDDFYNINEHAENMEKIDGKLKEVKETEEGLRKLVETETERAKSAETKNAEDIEEVSSGLTSEINNKISDLIGGAPETLDTLKEIADAIAENETIVDALNEAIGKKVNIDDFNTQITSLGKSVAEGKQLLAATLSGWGPSPVASDATFEVLNSAINNTVGTYGDNRYNQGYVKGVQDADGRALPGTVNYQSGYNQGVADADGRANSNSANWQNGHSVGYQAGVAAELNAIAGAWTTHGTVTGRLYMYIVEHNDSGYIWNTCNMANLSWVPGNVNEVYGYGTDGIKVEIFCIDGAAVSLQDFDAWLYGRNAYPSGFPVWKIKHTWSWVL
ncbi:MAG: hypothetical protein HFI77_10760 [Lachnospiraceae bacterium]|nr:hypothetical protein [Lachnospiraceae bacterium]